MELKAVQDIMIWGRVGGFLRTPNPGGECRPGISGPYAEGGVHFGPFEFGASSNSGYKQGSGPYSNPFTPSVSYTPSVGVGAGAYGTRF